MRAVNLIASVLLLAALAVSSLLAVYVPLRLLGMASERRLDLLAAGVFAFISIAAGVVVAALAIIIGFPLALTLRGGEAVGESLARRRELEEKLAAYRARQRAMLEELDEIKRLLEEVRDLLKEGVGA